VRFREIGLVVGQSLDGVWDLRQARELATATRELVAMFARLAAERRADPRDDVVTRLAAAERDNELVARDLLATCGLLLVAGFETTVNLIGNGVAALQSEPALWHGLAAVEETLRWDSPVQVTVRVAKQDIELDGHRLRRGRVVALMLAAANRNPAVATRTASVRGGQASPTIWPSAAASTTAWALRSPGWRARSRSGRSRNARRTYVCCLTSSGVPGQRSADSRHCPWPCARSRDTRGAVRLPAGRVLPNVSAVGPGRLSVVSVDFTRGEHVSIRENAAAGISWQCPRCGAPYKLTDAYCGSCGQSFEAPPGGHGVFGKATSVQSTSDQTEPPGPLATSDATRYMCAAVYRDRKLAEHVIDRVVDEPYKAPPRSPDVDLVAVVQHALAARRRGLRCDLVLTVFALVVLIAAMYLGPSIEILVPAGIVLIGGAWVIVYGEQLTMLYGVVGQGLRPRRVEVRPRPPRSSALRRRLASLAEAERGNVSVYGGYSPFFGSGSVRESWSFVLDISRSAEGATALPFTADELHDFVTRDVRAVGLARVSVEDRMFVDGRDLASDSRFVAAEPAPPQLYARPELISTLRAVPEDRVRPYACFHILGWGGQLVCSTHLRFVVTRRHLFAEATHCILPPIKEKYQEIDRIASKPTLRQASQIGGRTLLSTPLRLLAAPFRLLQFVRRPFVLRSRRAEQSREIIHEKTFNYGAAYSPRESFADTNFQRYFQQLDFDQYVKIVEDNVFQAMVDFLDEHGIDTSRLVERQTTIQNNGVFVSGNATVNATNIAAGKKAEAKSSTSHKTEPSPAARVTSAA
jgi:hypothetical protein